MDMKNILASFDAASSGKKVGTAGAAKNEMKAILESLQECGMGMPSAPMSPPMEDKVTMNVSLNAKGIDAIDDLVRLMGGKKEMDMEPKGMEMPVAIGPKPMDKHDDMARLMAIASAEHGDDEEMESWDNSPEEEYSDHNTMLNDLSGGINRQKKMYAKAQDGDNAMSVHEEELDELSDIKSQLSALWKAKVKSLDEAEVNNPYQGADAEKFAAMSPEDQEWLTRGGRKPDINDLAILSRAPNGGRPASAPAPAPTAGPDDGTRGGQQPAAAPAAQSGAGDEAAAQAGVAARQQSAAAPAGNNPDEADPAADAQADDAARQQPAAAQGAGQEQGIAAAPRQDNEIVSAPAAKPAKQPAAGGAGKATKADADALTKAIKDFQTKAGLKVDGIIGKNTLAAMKAAQSAQAAPAAPDQSNAETQRLAAAGRPAAEPAADNEPQGA